jgi:ParB family chromosome partitioning protein
MAREDIKYIAANKMILLRRNPQFLTMKQMNSLKESIKRDGFCAPILVRPMKKGKYEVISGNHRFMAAQELNIAQIPCVVKKMNDRTAKRLALNLNMIHGDPNAEILAPFLAELDDKLLAEIHLEKDLLGELKDFDGQLKERLDSLQIPDSLDNDSKKFKNEVCECPKCHRKHLKTQ